MNLIDSHCHLVSYQYSPEETADIINRAVQAGVTQMITLGTLPENWEDHLKLAELHPGHVKACLGIHPCDVHEAPEDAMQELERHASAGKLAALGETGLDYYHPAPEGWDEHKFRLLQQDYLVRHFELAEKTGLNAVIHTRDRKGDACFDDALALAARYAGKVRSMFHCFIGTREQARRILDIGGLLSFTGIVTFKNASQVLDVARWCPAGSFTVETDSPYLAPEPHRGRRNEPAYVVSTAQKIAEARGESLHSLAESTSEASKSFFFPKK